MSKYGFTIKPNNKKLLKSSKVRKYFAYVEEKIYKELINNKEFQELMITGLTPPEQPWFTLFKEKNDTSN